MFLLAHQEMIGFRFLHLPDAVADVMTLVVIAGGIFFLQRRLVTPYVNNVTYLSDYLLILAVMAPFVTGYLAYHQWFDYRTTLIVHMLAGEAMLVLIPFTRLGHALFFFLYRFTIGGEYSFGQGKRAW